MAFIYLDQDIGLLYTPYMNTNEYAWAAGIIDGEGCIYITVEIPNSNNFQVSLSHRLSLEVRMVHQPTILKLQHIFNIGSVKQRKPRNKHHKTQWRWCVLQNEAAKVLTVLQPFLFVKQSQCRVALRFHKLCKRHWHRNNELIPFNALLRKETCRIKLHKLNHQ